MARTWHTCTTSNGTQLPCPGSILHCQGVYARHMHAPVWPRRITVHFPLSKTLFAFSSAAQNLATSAGSRRCHQGQGSEQTNVPLRTGCYLTLACKREGCARDLFVPIPNHTVCVSVLWGVVCPMVPNWGAYCHLSVGAQGGIYARAPNPTGLTPFAPPPPTAPEFHGAYFGQRPGLTALTPKTSSVN